MRYCTLCGDEIDSDAPHYYSKCRACYWGAKQQEAAVLAAELEKQRVRAERFKTIAIGRRRRRRTDAETVNELLMFIHPDKHQDAPMPVQALSNDLTRWLIAIRDKQRNAR